MKKIMIAAVVALSLMIAPAVAGLNQFYERTVGQWTVEGYRGDQEFCAAKTFWDDGTYVSVFKLNSSGELGLYIHNKSFNIGDPPGTNKQYQLSLRFDSNKYNQKAGTIDYELVDSQTVIVHNLNDAFVGDWLSYDVMWIIMPGNIGSLSVGLNGTNNAVDAMVECMDKLKGVNI